MKPLPRSNLALLVRTDFSNQQAWDEIREIIKTPVDGFYAYVEYVDDPAYEGLTRDQILDLFGGHNQSYAMIADKVTIEDPDHPLLIIDLFNSPNPEFRAIPSTIQQIENNLSIANLDFADFANAVDERGIYRGFPEF